MVVAKEPLKYVENLLRSIPPVEQTGLVSIADEDFYDGLRGISGFSAARDVASGAAEQASELIDRFTLGHARKGDVWAWEFRLLAEDGP